MQILRQKGTQKQARGLVRRKLKQILRQKGSKKQAKGLMQTRLKEDPPTEKQIKTERRTDEHNLESRPSDINLKVETGRRIDPNNAKGRKLDAKAN